MKIVQEAFLLPVGAGNRFCVWRAPTVGEPRGLIVHVPAFAEEMNKSRRMTAWAARELAVRGFGVLHMDPLGCGDSSGDFGDATWQDWIQDVELALQWARQRVRGPVWLWAHRVGALLACAALRAAGTGVSLLLWQPVLSGRQYLTQFLRLRLAAEMLSDTGARSRMKELRQQLLNGASLEVAGYRISSGMAIGLEQAEFEVNGSVERIVWLEVNSSDLAEISPGAQSRIDALRSKGIAVGARVVRGPPFWNTLDIEDCPELIEASTAYVRIEDESDVSRNPLLL